jgi:hypothetical protein
MNQIHAVRIQSAYDSKISTLKEFEGKYEKKF